MDKKTHYKLYKGGKNWLCMAIATISVVMFSSAVHADNQETTEIQNNSSLNVSKNLTQVSAAPTVQIESNTYSVLTQRLTRKRRNQQ